LRPSRQGRSKTTNKYQKFAHTVIIRNKARFMAL
jgi:hypothetical protein